MTQNQETGNLGERLARDYLVSKGYRIIERNFRRPWGELDIVTTASDKTLVFVEVKTLENKLEELSSLNRIQPEENLTQAKLRKLQRTASLYANSHSKLINDNRGWRIDLVAIDIFADGKFDLRHYENI